jgi:thiamine biosynthesis lipoprotein
MLLWKFFLPALLFFISLLLIAAMKDEEGKSVLRFVHLAMGTTFELLIDDRDEKYAGQVSQAVFTEIDRIESLFTRFNPGSEIGQINHLQSGQPLSIGVEIYECLQTALWLQAQTNGAFDINIGSLEKSGEEKKPENGPPRINILEQMKLFKTSQGFAIEILPAEGTASAVETNKTAALSLDLGGIGKGYALDRTLELLSDWEVNRALIHGGTSTALAVGTPSHGTGKGKGWPVGIGGDWECPQALDKFFLKDRALSGSGTEVKGEHIIDPRAGSRAKGHLAAWVSHPSAAVADALSTAFMVMGTEEVRTFCESHSDVWSLVVIDPHTCEVFNPEHGGHYT